MGLLTSRLEKMGDLHVIASVIAPVVSQKPFDKKMLCRLDLLDNNTIRITGEAKGMSKSFELALGARVAFANGYSEMVDMTTSAPLIPPPREHKRKVTSNTRYMIVGFHDMITKEPIMYAFDTTKAPASCGHFADAVTERVLSNGRLN